MNKIEIFYGAEENFKEIIQEDLKEVKSFGNVVNEYDRISKIVPIKINPNDKVENLINTEKIRVKTLVIYANEYASVNEHVLINFLGFLSNFDIDNLYIQNPPDNVLMQLYKEFGEKIIDINYQEYRKIQFKHIKKFNEDYNKYIIGQELVKNKMLRILYRLFRKKDKKPIVLMFYGKSGIGKTETARFLSDIIEQPLFRKQFSMYQNNDFLNYLYGSKYNENSFAKDLLTRESNILLLDEFDKAPSIFNSAFYQLFDEGIYEDKNYKVNLENSIIICTSNYLTADEIKEKIGDPLFYRFDECIEFKDLDKKSIEEISNQKIDKYFEELSKEEIEFLQTNKTREKLIKFCLELSNVREIDKSISNYICKILVEEALRKNRD